MAYPWQTSGGLMPWQLNQPFVGSDGNVYTPFADPNSPTGYSVKHSDQYGEDIQPIDPPINPAAQQQYWEQTPYGQRLRDAEEGRAEENDRGWDYKYDELGLRRDQAEWNNEYQMGMLGVNQQQANTGQYNAQTGRLSAETDAEYKKRLMDQAREELGFKYYQQTGDLNFKYYAQNQNNDLDYYKTDADTGFKYYAQDQDTGFKYYQQNQQNDQQTGRLGLDTLSLGASLKGPRNWDTYLDTAAAAGQNPQLQNAVGAWASLTGNAPRTGPMGAAPERMDLNALASDFGVGQVQYAPQQTYQQGPPQYGQYQMPQRQYTQQPQQPGQMSGPGWSGPQQGQPQPGNEMYAGGNPNFDYRTGEMRSTMPIQGGGGFREGGGAAYQAVQQGGQTVLHNEQAPMAYKGAQQQQQPVQYAFSERGNLAQGPVAQSQGTMQMRSATPTQQQPQVRTTQQQPLRSTAPQRQRISALDDVAMGKGNAAPGWWQRQSRDERERAMGYWESNGHSPNTVLDRLAWTSPNQGLGYGGA